MFRYLGMSRSNTLFYQSTSDKIEYLLLTRCQHLPIISTTRKKPESYPQRTRNRNLMLASYLEEESRLSVFIASCTVVMNCAGKMMVEFFSVAISAIV